MDEKAMCCPLRARGIFVSPDDSHVSSPAEYRAAVAACVRDAALLGMIPARLVVHPGARPLELAQADSLWLLDKIAASDQAREHWIAVENLQPEIGHCVRELRWMETAERRIWRGAVMLGELRGKVAGPGQGIPAWPADHLAPATRREAMERLRSAGRRAREDAIAQGLPVAGDEGLTTQQIQARRERVLTRLAREGAR
jgi:hypothetical protein